MERKYTGKTLKREVNRYFKSISREVEITERKPTGELDKYGHMIFEDVPVYNRLGQPMKRIEFIIPPQKRALAAYLHISPSTYSKWEDAESYPEFAETLATAHEICLLWRNEQMLTRSGKDVKGIAFDLAVNYGISEKVEVKVTGGIEDFLRKLEEDDGI